MTTPATKRLLNWPLPVPKCAQNVRPAPTVVNAVKVAVNEVKAVVNAASAAATTKPLVS